MVYNMPFESMKTLMNPSEALFQRKQDVRQHLLSYAEQIGCVIADKGDDQADAPFHCAHTLAEQLWQGDLAQRLGPLLEKIQALDSSDPKAQDLNTYVAKMWMGLCIDCFEKKESCRVPHGAFACLL